MYQRNAGFSLLEACVVTGLVALVSTVAVIQMKSALATLDADKAANLVQSQFNYARQLAVNDRRNVSIGFSGANGIKVTRQESGGGTTLMSDVTLPTGYTFAYPSGVVDTPDQFLAGSSLYLSIGTVGTAVFIGAGTTGTFIGDGTFVDGSNVLLNGSVFTKGSTTGSSRAITLSGSSGRVKQYWPQSSAWKAK